MIDDTTGLFIVTDLKQYAHCPRIVYYEQCTPDFRPRTHKMDIGKLEHDREVKRASRRQLSRYGLEQGERHFDVQLTSATLGLVGRIDEIILTEDAAYPVDYKLSRKIWSHYALQLAAYAMLIEDQCNVPVPHGYLHLIKRRQVEKVEFTGALLEQVDETLEMIRRITQFEYLPPPPKSNRPCQACEFRRACNDVR